MKTITMSEKYEFLKYMVEDGIDVENLDDDDFMMDVFIELNERGKELLNAIYNKDFGVLIYWRRKQLERLFSAQEKARKKASYFNKRG